MGSVFFTFIFTQQNIQEKQSEKTWQIKCQIFRIILVFIKVSSSISYHISNTVYIDSFRGKPLGDGINVRVSGGSKNLVD